MADENDKKPSGGNDKKTEDKKPAEDKDVGADDAVKLEAKLKEANDRAAKLEAKEKKRLEEEAKKKEDDDVANGKAKELLAQKKGELETALTKLAELEKRQKDRNAAIIEKLPVEEQEMARMLEKKLTTDDLSEYLEKKAGIGGSSGSVPPFGTPGGDAGKSSAGGKKRELSKDSKELLDSLNARDSAYAISKELETTELGAGERKFTMGLDKFIRALRRRSTIKQRTLGREEVETMFK